MKRTFYEKVGRKYVPVSEYDGDLLSALPKGTHLVMSYPGGQSTRHNIEPAYAAMIAAGRVAEDAISKTIMEASRLRCPEQRKPLTDKQVKAWKKLAKEMGTENYALEWPSYREAAEEGVKAMQVEAEKLLSNPSVKKAYEHFLLVCELTKENKEENA